MANFADFKDQHWFNKRDEVLQRANYICEYCGEYNKDAQVHISYYPKGKRLWEFPEEAYKCYCPKHREDRQRAEEVLREVLANFSTDELDSLYSAMRELSIFPKNKRAQFSEQLYSYIKNHPFKLQMFDLGEDEQDEY